MTSSYTEKITKLKNALENVFVKKTDVKNNLTSTDTDKPLSANQGKQLNDNKVDKVSGKGLSKNDFTDTYKGKLDNLDTNLGNKASSTHTHGNLQNDGSVGTSNNISKNVVTDGNGKITTEDKPSIPADVADLTDNSNTQFTPKSHNHGNLQNDGSISTSNNTNKNVVTDSNGKITIEEKPIIPKVFYGTCTTSASAQIKEVTTSSNYILDTGTILIVKFTNGQTYNSSSTNTLQLKINNNTNINVEYVVGQKGIRYHWATGEIVQFVYDGSNFVMIDEGAATTTYWGVTKLYDGVDSTSTGVAATPNSVKIAYDLANSKADFNHTHSDYVNPTIVNDLTTGGTTSVLSAEQGKVLANLIGDAISYINQ